MASDRDEERHDLVRKINHGEGQLREALAHVEVDKRENPENLRGNQQAANNAKRFVEHNRAEPRQSTGSQT